MGRLNRLIEAVLKTRQTLSTPAIGDAENSLVHVSTRRLCSHFEVSQ